ncbi:LOW QUALITY PROTEIN: Adenylate-forming reductase [Paramyrothecium foliicola]|nr:LOW QUALITY PROTEIN: Adenylate-forming reductase [Paramyrothecium foliicola]
MSSAQQNGAHSIMATMGRGEVIDCPFSTVTAAFYHHAGTRPAALAVRDMSGKARELTYQQLASRVQALTARLLSMGVQPQQRVPLVVKRGLEMVIGIWAVLSCGAQYVPLDGGVVPDSTIRQVVEQSDAVVLCLSSTRDRLCALCPGVSAVVIDEEHNGQCHQTKPSEVIDLATSESGCYVIYTSGENSTVSNLYISKLTGNPQGTTGRPKGVDVTHKNVSNLVCLYPGNLGICPGTRVGQMLNISFDMAAWEIFACLCNGGTLVLRGANWEPTLEEQRQESQQHRGIGDMDPWLTRRHGYADTPCLSLADLWATYATYWNCCGPTETTIVNTMQKHIPGDGINIGKPTPNNTVYILDEDFRPVPAGVAGVMWAGGHGVSRGYVGLESKTREVYIPDRFASKPSVDPNSWIIADRRFPAGSSCMYKTGDVGRWRQDGCIEILGRVDDQVKVKGFRVELDGISATLASAPGVARATTLLIDGEIHGFTTPVSYNVSAIFAHTQKRQPYYAVPSQILELDHFPITNNGKIDKKALAVIARARVLNEKWDTVSLDSGSDHNTLVEVRSISTESTLTAVSEKYDLNRDIEGKHLAQPLRGLRHRLFIVYRVLFSIIGLLNLGAFIAIAATNARLEWLGTLTAANLVTAVLVRQDMVINLLYTITCSVPKGAPLWLRKRCAKVYHLGGVHSGAAICATAWLVASTIAETVALLEGSPKAGSLATLVISWILCALCLGLIAFSWPSFRKKYHNVFEQIHRFVGWIALCLFWIRTILSTMDSTPQGQDMGLALAKSPAFWLLGISTCSIASSWFTLRRVPVVSEPLSDHAIRLTFDYTVPVNGTFTRISTRPLLEWHSFATIPNPKSSASNTTPGYSLVVSNAGDWTKACIRNPPTKLWVRGVPTCGVMRIATLFNRLVVIATGSGIGPLLGHIKQPTCPTQLIWSASQPEESFGKDTIDTIRNSIPDAVIHDTKALGRPDLVRMGYNLVKDFGAEAVIVIANEKITKKIVYGLETRGIPAYGAIWDS